jgi:outer membrane protein TolC
VAAPAPPARTSNPAPAPSVESLVSQAIGRYPTVRALKQRLAAAREQVAPAGALPDPMVGVMYQSVGTPWRPMAMSMGVIEVSQPIFYPGKRAARRQAATSEAAMRAAELVELRFRVATEVRRTYARVYVLDRERESVEAARELVQTLVEAVAGRYAAGQAEQEAVLKVELERFRLKERLVDIGAERAALVAILDRLTERDASAPFGVVGELPSGKRLPGRAADAALARSPAVLVQRASIQAARDRMESARLETKPNFLVGLSAGSTVEAEPVVIARFGLELPIWSGDKQDPLVRAAGHELDAAREDLAASEANIRSEAARLEAQWTRDNDQIERYEQAILPQTAAVLQAATSSYVAGRGDFSMLIEDFRLWLDARVSFARRRADRFMTWAELEELTAGKLEVSAR